MNSMLGKNSYFLVTDNRRADDCHPNVPVEAAMKIEFVIDLETAKQIGLRIPQRASAYGWD